jgi:hypothetical protein
VNLDAANAIPRLVEAGILPEERAPTLLRAAQGRLVSVRLELRLVLYVGVLLVMAGVGLLIEENLDRIGPGIIAAVIGLAAAAALGWVAWIAPPFSRGEVPSPNLAFDYILLLGVLLAAADLAYIEVQFTPLGPNWTWHLLLVALGAAVAAVRFDSRVVFALALATFAAWRGVSVSPYGNLAASESVVRWNAIGCGVLFILLGFGMKRAKFKAHFEPAAVHLGWLLILGALASGIELTGEGRGWAAMLFFTGAALAAGAFRWRRFPLFAFGVLGGYVGLSALVVSLGDVAAFGCFWFFATSLLVIVGLVVAQRRMREPL